MTSSAQMTRGATPTATPNVMMDDRGPSHEVDLRYDKHNAAVRNPDSGVEVNTSPCRWRES